MTRKYEVELFLRVSPGVFEVQGKTGVTNAGFGTELPEAGRALGDRPQPIPDSPDCLNFGGYGLVLRQDFPQMGYVSIHGSWFNRHSYAPNCR